MTSTTSSNNKKAFSVLYKWAFKRNKFITVIFSILMALGVILDLYTMSEMSNVDYLGASTTIAKEYSSIGYASMIIAQGGAMFFTLISALLTFSFLHNKRSVDMFGALPTTRTTTLISHLLGGMSAVAAPYFIGSLVVMGITCRTLEYFIFDLLVLLGGIIGIAAAYVFTTLIAYCCGTTLDTTIITIAVNAIFAGTVGLFWGIAAEIIPGIDFENVISTPLITLLSPYAFCFFGDFYYMATEYSAYILLMIWNVLFTIGVFFLTLFAAKNRKAEIAQSEFDVKWLPIAIKAGGSIVCGGFIGTIAATTSDSGYANMIIYTFWYLLISFAAFFILHILFTRGRKGTFKKSFIVYVAVTVVSLGLTFALTSGLGIDTYVPAASNVRSVIFDYSTEFKDPENIEIITEIHKCIAEGLHSEYEYPYYLGNDTIKYDYYNSYDSSPTYGTTKSMKEKYPLTNRTSFNIRYMKKIGFRTDRDYYLYADQMKYYDFDKIEGLLRKLYNSDEWKQSSNRVIWDKEIRAKYAPSEAPVLTYMQYIPETVGDADASYGYYNNFGYSTVGSITLPKDEKFINGLYDAIAKDILADKEYYKNAASFMHSDDPSISIGDTYYTLSVRYERLDDKLAATEFRYNNFGLDVGVPIHEDYTNTLKYLEDNGIPTNYNMKDADMFFNEPYDYVQNSGDNDNAESYYVDFGYAGEYTSLDGLVRAISTKIEYMGLLRSGYDGDYDEWVNEHHTEFLIRLTDSASKLYKEYSADPAYLKSNYTNKYTREVMGTDEHGMDYLYMEDEIIKELEKESEKIIAEINESAANGDSKNSKSTDTDSKPSNDTSSAQAA